MRNGLFWMAEHCRIWVLLAGVLMFGFAGEAYAENMLKNPSFEEINDKDLPQHWSWPKQHTDPAVITLHRNVEKAHHGSNYLTVKVAKKRALGLYGRRADKAPNSEIEEDVTLSAWVKGKGRIRFRFQLGGGYVQSKSIRINSNKWRRYEYSKRIGAQVEKRGKMVDAKLCIPGIVIYPGEVALDNIAMTRSGAKPEKDYIGSEKKPLVTVPQMDAPPTIDGIIEADEWAGAAAITGFKELSGPMSKRQTIVYVAFDEKHLYCALDSVHKGRFGQEKKARDQYDLQTEAFEIWLQPPGKGWLQLIGMPQGRIYDAGKAEKAGWNPRWQYRDKVVEMAETIQGVLSFDKKRWTAEAAIPFEELGVSAPKDGEEWALNFTRDYSVGPGKSRTRVDYTTWANVRTQFNDVSAFGRAVFDRTAPAIQWTQFGNLVGGKMEISMKGRSPKPLKLAVQAKITLAKRPEKMVAKGALSLDMGPKRKSFALERSYVTLGNYLLHLNAVAYNPLTGKILARQHIPFRSQPPLRLRACPMLSKGSLFVEVDAGRVPNLPNQAVVEVSVISTKLYEKAPVTTQRPVVKFRISIADLKPGEYQVQARLKNAGGDEIASSTAAMSVPERPVWLGNKIGVSEKVPPPWTPVEVHGTRASVTERVYDLAANGLPAQVSSLGSNLFARPCSLIARVDGKDVKFEFEPLVKTAQREQEVTWKLSGKGGPLLVNGNVTVEFDGFAVYEFTVTPKRPVKLDSLALEFPLYKKHARYVRTGKRYAFLDGNGGDDSRNAVKKIVKIHSAFLYSPAGWVWPRLRASNIWVGDDNRGFAVISESNENVRGPKYLEFITSRSQRLMRVNLISKPEKIEKALFYRYGYTATPHKPRSTNPRMWHSAYTGGSKIEFWDSEYGNELLKRLFVGTRYHVCKHVNYAKLRAGGAAVNKRMIELFHQHGAKIVTNTYTSACSEDVPGWKHFKGEWTALPISGWTDLLGKCTRVCHRASYPDFFLYQVKGMLDDLKLDGVYLDASGVTSCTNEAHGCGYQRAGESTRQPTRSLRASRELYKRLWTLLHTKGRNGVIFHHGLNPDVGSFIDVGASGEYWCGQRPKKYEILTPEMFRTCEMRTQYGFAYTWYAFSHLRSWKFPPGTATGVPEILAIALPHNVMPVCRMQEIFPYWDLLDKWWTTSEFVMYSDDTPAGTCGDKNILVSAYIKRAEKRALIVVANWNYAPAQARVVLNFSKLGIDAGKARITDALNDQPVTRQGAEIHLEMPQRNLRILLVQ